MSNDAYRQPAPPEAQAQKPYIGGQAVLEGVMMRSPTSFAIVVRRRDGSLVVRERPITDDRRGARRLPFIRGVASLVESLRLGSEALRFSAEQMEQDMEAEEAEGGAEKKDAEKAKKGTGVTSVLGALGLSLFYLMTQDAEESGKAKAKGPFGFMLLVAIVVLVALPQAATAGVNRALHLGLEVQSPAFQAITGAFKLFIVIGYMLVIRRMHYIKRVFQYHGAEHKTISTYEAGDELVVANARKQTTLHPRCGTTFLVMVALVSILVFTLVGSALPRIQTGTALLDNVVFFLEKLPFLPVIAAATFELQRVFARYCTTGPLRVLLWPGFLVQKITTIEPDDRQLEVALASLRVTLFRERGESSTASYDVRFESFSSLARAPSLRPKQAA
jgi:uncharacterized protein YqhQ